MKASELAAEARDEIFKGWTRNAYVRENGDVCAVGALTRVALRNMAFTEAGVVQKSLDDKAREIYKVTMVQHANDGLCSKQDVLDLFDKTIIGLEEVGL